MQTKMNKSLLLAGAMATIFFLYGRREVSLTNIEENISSY